MPRETTDSWAWAPVILLTTAAIQYTGATIAIGLFSTVAVTAVAWGRGFSVRSCCWRGGGPGFSWAPWKGGEIWRYRRCMGCRSYRLT